MIRGAGIQCPNEIPEHVYAPETLWRALCDWDLDNEERLLAWASRTWGWSVERSLSLSDPKVVSEWGQDPQWRRCGLVPLYKKDQVGMLACACPYPSEQGAEGWERVLVPRAVLDAQWVKSGVGATPLEEMYQLLREGMRYGASDIHLLSGEARTQCWIRLEGTLYFLCAFSKSQAIAIVNTLKVHAKMDISALRMPQDGRLSYQGSDVRVATLPTAWGEDVVLRLFDGAGIRTLDQLGFSQRASATVRQFLNHQSGLILVTGPTGSGKTTTLYACLEELRKKQGRMIVTLEDPIERLISGIRQSQINPAVGYTFAQGLRSVLRQDPDCIMIGEIRDAETAKTALEAAYTGHLVLASLHTEDCAMTIHRLSGFQLDPFLVVYSLKGIISQKLTSFNGKRGVLTEIVDLSSLAQGQSIETVLGTSAHYTWQDDLNAKT